MHKNLFFIQSGLILILSAILKYQPPNFNEVNWDIVLFLTPYGIINNFFNKDTTVMWSFYSDISTGQIHPTNTQILLSIGLYITLVLSVSKYVNNERVKK